MNQTVRLDDVVSENQTKNVKLEFLNGLRNNYNKLRKHDQNYRIIVFNNIVLNTFCY